MSFENTPVSQKSSQRSSKYENLRVALKNGENEEDPELREIQMELQQMYSFVALEKQKNDSIHALTPKSKWKYTFKTIGKKQKITNIFRQSGTATALSNEALMILAVIKSNENTVLQSKTFTNSCTFDVFQIENDHPLMTVAYFIMIEQHKFDQQFSFDVSTFVTYLYRIEKEYQLTPYHNAYHAADVLLTLNWIFRNSSFIQTNFSELERFAALLGAIIHDVGHNGRSNAFHVNTLSDISVIYHEHSPLENFHVSTSFKCLYHSDSNWLSVFPAAESYYIKEILRECVLHTDMTHHQEGLDECANLLQTIDAGLDRKLNRHENLLVMKLMLHLADISNPMKPFDISLKWGLLVFQEFFAQGDEEENLGLRPSPMCDRNSSHIVKGQVGFAKFVVLPYLEMMLFLLKEETFQKLKTNLLKNIKIYASTLKDINEGKCDNTVDAVQKMFESMKI